MRQNGGRLCCNCLQDYRPPGERLAKVRYKKGQAKVSLCGTLPSSHRTHRVRLKRVSGREQQAEPVEGERRPTACTACAGGWRQVHTVDREKQLFTVIIQINSVQLGLSVSVLCRGPRFPLAAEAV